MRWCAMRSVDSECSESGFRTRSEMNLAAATAERLGFALEGIQRRANLLPGGKAVDRHCYSRFDVTGLPELEVTWERR